MTATQIENPSVGRPGDQAELERLLAFWFDGMLDDSADFGALMRRWFKSQPAEDRELERRFGALAKAAASGQLDSWAATPHGRLALVLLLDQLPRNLHRGTKEAFAGDGKALRLTLEGLERGDIDSLHPLERMFVLMPLQHAESPEVQAQSVERFEALARDNVGAPFAGALASSARYAREHRDIVGQFGRFPHRNRLLGRDSTSAEREYLAGGGSSFGQ